MIRRHDTSCMKTKVVQRINKRMPPGMHAGSQACKDTLTYSYNEYTRNTLRTERAVTTLARKCEESLRLLHAYEPERKARKILSGGLAER